MRGRLSDGRTARLIDVEIALHDEGLRLSLIDMSPMDGEALVVWPYAQIRLIDTVGADLRLGRRDDPDVRLVAPRELREALSQRAPGVLTRRGQSRRAAVLIGLGVVASMALIAAVFLGIPWAARPLAHATPAAVEKQLGAFAARQLGSAMPLCEGPNAQAALAALAPLTQRLERAAGVAQPITYAFVAEDAPNALALPGGQVWITHGLLEALNQPDQLAAVLAHEIGHVHARDALEGFYRRIGLGAALEIMTGGSGVGQQVILLSGDLAELGYTRGQEARADRASLKAMADAGYDPAALARAFDRMEAAMKADDDAEEGQFALDLPGWLSSHPETEARKQRALAATRAGRPQPLAPETWAVVRAACADNDALPQTGAEPAR